MSKRPPIPPASRPPKDPGAGRQAAPEPRRKPGGPPENLREQGDAGNTKQNTTNDGYQQDR
jgi:hypothetical protein